jgi:hypothetical protein
MNKVRFMFLRDEKKQPIGCLAIQINEPNIYYAWSVVNPLDKFDRARARNIATIRLGLFAKCYGISNFITPDVSMHDVSRAVMQDLVLNKSTPTRARKAAELWLQNQVVSKGVSHE